MMSTVGARMSNSAQSVADDPRWARIVARDRTADGEFWYSVVTTGIYGRDLSRHRISGSIFRSTFAAPLSSRESGTLCRRYRSGRRSLERVVKLDVFGERKVMLTSGAYMVLDTFVLLDLRGCHARAERHMDAMVTGNLASPIGSDRECPICSQARPANM